MKTIWYIHTFNEEKLYVVLSGKWFEIALHKDESWNEMIKYGVNYAKVEKHFLSHGISGQGGKRISLPEFFAEWEGEQ